MENMPVTPEQPVTSPQEDSDDKVVFKRSHFYSVMVVFAFAVGILVGYMAWGRGTPTQPAAVAAAEESPSFRRFDIPTEGFPNLGPEDAEIVLVEFSDYQ
jgi:hypothetical protein